jgi:gas vesicle protein
MSTQSSRFKLSARRGSAVAASLAIAAFGLGAAGCGDDTEQVEEDATEALDSLRDQAESVQQSVDERAEEVQQEAEQQAEEAKQDYGY